MITVVTIRQREKPCDHSLTDLRPQISSVIVTRTQQRYAIRQQKDTSMHRPEMGTLLEHLTDELNNFEDIAKYLMPQPGELPDIAGIDVFGGTLALNGSVGGDHIIYVDFKQRYDLQARINRAIDEGKPELVENLKRCQKMAGIVVIDVEGHQVTDAL